MDTITLTDRRSNREASVRRPDPTWLGGSEVIALEELVRTWINPLRQQAAEEALDRLAGERPARLIYGLLWLTGLWCSLLHARMDVPLDELVGGLDYTGGRRELAGIDDQTWAIGTQLVRKGVSSVLGSDEEAEQYLGSVVKLEPSLRLVRDHLLILMDGLSQDMESNDLAPWGAAAHIVTGAGWA